MTISPNDFRSSLSRFASGVTIVTCRDAEGLLHGITVSAFCSVSLEPPQILICVEKSAGSHHALKLNSPFVVNILNSQQSELSEHFASHIADKFTAIPYRTNSANIPLLQDCLATLECQVSQIYDGGDHTIFVGKIDLSTFNDGEPLVYFQSGYHKIADVN